MRIGLLTDGILRWLAGNPDLGERSFSSASDFRMTPKINIQTDQFLRGAAVRVRDRKNLATTITFGTTREFPTVWAAENWVLDYEATQPREGQLILESQMGGGAVVRRYLANAVVEPPDRQVIGVSVILKYTIQGGAITSA